MSKVQKSEHEESYGYCVDELEQNIEDEINGISKNEMDIMDAEKVKNMKFELVNYDEVNLFLNGQNIEYQNTTSRRKVLVKLGRAINASLEGAGNVCIPNGNTRVNSILSAAITAGTIKLRESKDRKIKINEDSTNQNDELERVERLTQMKEEQEAKLNTEIITLQHVISMGKKAIGGVQKVMNEVKIMKRLGRTTKDGEIGGGILMNYVQGMMKFGTKCFKDYMKTHTQIQEALNEIRYEKIKRGRTNVVQEHSTESMYGVDNTAIKLWKAYFGDRGGTSAQAEGTLIEKTRQPWKPFSEMKRVNGVGPLERKMRQLCKEAKETEESIREMCEGKIAGYQEEECPEGRLELRIHEIVVGHLVRIDLNGMEPLQNKGELQKWIKLIDKHVGWTEGDDNLESCEGRDRLNDLATDVKVLDDNYIGNGSNVKSNTQKHVPPPTNLPQVASSADNVRNDKSNNDQWNGYYGEEGVQYDGWNNGGASNHNNMHNYSPHCESDRNERRGRTYQAYNQYGKGKGKGRNSYPENQYEHQNGRSGKGGNSYHDNSQGGGRTVQINRSSSTNHEGERENKYLRGKGEKGGKGEKRTSTSRGRKSSKSSELAPDEMVVGRRYFDICKRELHKGKCDDAKCEYNHLSQQEYDMTIDCPEHSIGKCKHGNQCHFKHPGKGNPIFTARLERKPHRQRGSGQPMYISMIGNKHTKHAYNQDYLRLSLKEKEIYNEAISKQHRTNEHKGDSRKTQEAAERFSDEEPKKGVVKNTRQREAKQVSEEDSE